MEERRGSVFVERIHIGQGVADLRHGIVFVEQIYIDQRVADFSKFYKLSHSVFQKIDQFVER